MGWDGKRSAGARMHRPWEGVLGWDPVGQCVSCSPECVRFCFLNFISLFQVTFVLLLPGLNQHGIILKYIGMAKREINKLLKQKEKKNE